MPARRSAVHGAYPAPSPGVGRGTLGAVNSYDALGYGTHLILDGFRATAADLAGAGDIDDVLTAFGALIEPASGPQRRLIQPGDDGTEGVSAAVVGSEAHLCLHTFGTLRKLSLEAFSTRTLPVQSLTELFVERFAVGRYEAHVRVRGRLLPRQDDALRRALEGDRQYARVRLRDLLSA